MVSSDPKRSANNVAGKKDGKPLAKSKKPIAKSFGKHPGGAGGRPGGTAGGRQGGSLNPGFRPANKFKGKPGQAGPPTPQPGEKQDWAKFKQEKKDLKLKRKSSRDTYEVSKQIMQIYEKLRCRRTVNKDKLVEEIYKILDVGDTISKVVKAHDTARVLQCMLKYASPSLRSQISEKLLPHTVEMCQSKYAQFCVKRMLKYGSPATKSKLADSLMGHIVRLAGHNIASGLLDSLYLGGSPLQKAYMRQEFYGDLYRKAKDGKVKCLEDTYKDAANMKASILGSVKANLDHVANKQLVDSSLVHAVMLEYLRASEDNDEILEETVTAFAALVPHMLSTKEGSEAAVICFYKSTPKNRRAIIKNIKEHLLKIATHEHGHVFLISLLNSLDDTKATKKAIYDNLHNDLKSLVANQYGRRVIQWLVAPGDTSCFHPGFIKTIEEGLAFGKKEKDARRKEIFEQIEDPIAEAIVADPSFWLSNRPIGLATADILNHIKGESYKKAVQVLVQVVAQPNWVVAQAEDLENKKQQKKKPQNDVEAIIAEATKQRKKLLQTEPDSSDDDDGDDSDSNSDAEEGQPKKKKSKQATEQTKDESVPSVPGMEDAGMHHVLKKIIKNDKDKQETSVSFAEELLHQLSSDVLQKWLAVNRGCFILLNLVQDNTSNAEILQKTIKADSQLLKLLKSQTTQGGKLLAGKLSLV
ncbi:protein penguin [Drosophila tropicalis]|uniref:protein penguin n=1 Tax=Drosophila tropicalis TaxID=46794 RepID=UPI0035AC0623